MTFANEEDGRYVYSAVLDMGSLPLIVLVTTIDALQHFEAG